MLSRVNNSPPGPVPTRPAVLSIPCLLLPQMPVGMPVLDEPVVGEYGDDDGDDKDDSTGVCRQQ